MNEQPFDALSVAHEFIGASMSVLPIKADGSKKVSLQSWKEYQTRPATDAEIKAWFGSGEAGIAVVGGKVSGNLLILDFDKHAEVVFTQFCNTVEREAPGLIKRLPIVRTPSGGAHLFCRTTGNCPSNAKLAQRPTNQDKPKDKPDTLIETRGDGGYALTIGSPSSCHPSGKKYVHDSLTPWPWLAPVIDDEELDTLLTVATSFDDMPVKTVKPPKRPATSEGARPGDEYNRRGDALALLLKHGWTVCREHGSVTYLTRPGKTRGVSATFGHCRTKDGVPLLRNFSTSSGLDLKAYSPFSLFAHLECGGDYSEAARRLLSEGYGEKIRPVPLRDGRWTIEAMDSPRPLYNLPAILEAVRSGQTVYVVEGEKAADALIGIGIIATTSAGGAETFKSADWQPLKGAIVRIWPDNDGPGEKYARNVQEILRNIGAAARIVRPFDLGHKEDAFDWIERQREANPEYATPETLREEIDRECASYLERYPDESETAAPSASAADSSANVTTEAIECNETEDDEDDGGEAKETPFPIHCLGEHLRKFVKSHASAIGVPYSFLALPVITILGSLLCGKRSLEVADTWYVHPVFWAAIVAPSGSRKSSGYMPATEEIGRLNDVEQKKYDRAFARYLEILKEYEKVGETSKPPKPRLRRVYVADATYEGLIRQMDRQQSPLLVVCDELNQWINSFTRYNNNSAINGWLSLHKLGPQIVTRADDSKNYNIPRAAASVFGTIQTDRFVEAMANDEFINSGFLARCLFTFAESGWQPFRKKSPHPIEGPAENYNQIVRNLHALPHPKSSDKPPKLEMAQGADEVWARWYNGTMNELRKESEQWPERSKQRSAWNSGLEKIEELPARLAIVLHAVDCIGPDQNAGDLNTPVSPETMANAIGIATWFVQGLRRVTRMIADQPAKNQPTYRPQTPEEYVLSCGFHRETGERLDIRSLIRRCRRYNTVSLLKPILDSLVKNGSLIIEAGETKTGKTKKFYRLP